MKIVSKITLKEAFNIPNILCYIRILLIPIFSYILLTSPTQKGQYIAAILIFLSGITDLLD
ncbi:MAG: CDP-alcohol phosphatidyltransferase family protein, partial [Oscillospiraceae bacterium]